MHYLFLCKNIAHQNDPRPYPEVNTDLFTASAAKAIVLMEDAYAVMKKITTSASFSKDLMSAAQQSKQSEVEKLIETAGIKKKPKITYNPDGITMNFEDFVANKECCHIILQLRWH